MAEELKSIKVTEHVYKKFRELCEHYQRPEEEVFEVILGLSQLEYDSALDFHCIPIELQNPESPGVTVPPTSVGGDRLDAIPNTNPFKKFAVRGVPSPILFSGPEQIKEFERVFGFDQPLRGCIKLKTSDGKEVLVNAEEYRIQKRSCGIREVFAIPKKRNDGKLEYEPSCLGPSRK
jgi:hypothetical protein